MTSKENNMEGTVAGPLEGLINFLSYFGFAVILLVAFCLIYTRITPYSELRLIREGKVAPSISFGGAIFGFVIPVASAILHSIGFSDMIIWAIVAMIVQIIVFLVLRMIFANMIKDIADDKIAPAALVAVFSIAIGILNAVSLSL
jgi:putative membrane protein